VSLIYPELCGLALSLAWLFVSDTSWRQPPTCYDSTVPLQTPYNTVENEGKKQNSEINDM